MQHQRNNLLLFILLAVLFVVPYALFRDRLAPPPPEPDKPGANARNDTKKPDVKKPDAAPDAVVSLPPPPPVTPQKRLVQQAVRILRDGGLVVYPTDSCYAFGCQMGARGAVEAIERIRRTDKHHNFTLMCRDLSEVATYGRVEDWAYRLLRAHTPGPWKVEDHGDNLVVFGPEHRGLSERVAVLFDGLWHKERSGRCHANARLIAAAPDLLEAAPGRDSEVRGLRRELVDEQQPAPAIGRRGRDWQPISWGLLSHAFSPLCS